MSIMVTSAREAVRQALYSTGAYGLLTWLRAIRGGTDAQLQGADLKARFDTIYKAGIWRHGDHATPGSGQGSSLASTDSLRRTLLSLLTQLGAKTLLDVGCGDLSWMQHLPIEADYIGIDVVDTVIERNREIFERPGRRFAVLDATIDELPEADVVLCREVLFHLSFDDIHRLLRNVLSKNRRWLILTSDRQTLFNSNIPTGDFRLLNLEARPFGFPPPRHEIDDSAVFPRRIVGVWDAAQVRERLI